VTDSPDEKRIPMILVRPEGRGCADEKRYPSRPATRDVLINVQEGERVSSGDLLMDGPRTPTTDVCATTFVIRFLTIHYRNESDKLLPRIPKCVSSDTSMD